MVFCPSMELNDIYFNKVDTGNMFLQFKHRNPIKHISLIIYYVMLCYQNKIQYSIVQYNNK